jgi:hypothetical protein
MIDMANETVQTITVTEEGGCGCGCFIFGVVVGLIIAYLIYG